MNSKPRADQHACTEVVLETVPDAAVVANLGVAAWILWDVEDRDRNFYMRGAMGGTTPTAMGIAYGIEDEVVALDGDGSLLMALGSLSTVGEFGPDNLTIVVMDNGTYGTTGGQPSAAEGVDFAGIAENCGIESFRASTTAEFRTVFPEAVSTDGPALVECLVEPDLDAGAPEGYDYGHSWLTNRFRTAILED